VADPEILKGGGVAQDKCTSQTRRHLSQMHNELGLYAYRKRQLAEEVAKANRG